MNNLKIDNVDDLLERVPSLRLYKGFLIREYRRGTKILVIQADRIEESKKFMLEEKITHLEINMSLGYPYLSITFLKDFTFVTSLTVVHQPLRNTNEINELHKLKELNLDSYFYSPLDFDNFPLLEECSIHWTPNAKNLFTRKTLKTLYTRSHKTKDANEYAMLENLEDLSIVNSPIETITAISTLKQLKKLDLALLRKLNSLDGVQNLTGLEILEITGCKKISSLNELVNLVHLKKLSINNCGDIQSLKPIETLEKLEELFFIEDTNIIDGNLNILTRLPLLKKYAFQNRKHYTQKRNISTNKISINE